VRGSILLGVLAGLVVVGAGLFVLLTVLPTEPLGLAGTPTPSPTPQATPSASPVSPSLSPSPSGPAPSGSGVGLSVGQQAPPLSVAQLGGGRVELETLRGKPLWLNFMATWCPPCQDELPVMSRFQGQLGERMTVILVDVKEPEDLVASFLTSLNVTLPVGLDSDARAQQAWSAYALPVHYWLDSEGVVRAFAYGGVGPEQFIEGVETVLPDAGLEP
jgi:thiol-disulfide isomerase/thioredoxin